MGFEGLFKGRPELAWRMWLGRELQREGAATEEALSPQVQSVVLGALSVVVSVDLWQQVGVWWWRRRRGT